MADGKELLAREAGELRVPSSVRRFEFHYTAPDLASPQSLRFRHKLEGMDPDWVDAGPQRVAYYSQLPPGDYHFRVMVGGETVDGTRAWPPWPCGWFHGFGSCAGSRCWPAAARGADRGSASP